MSACRGRRNGSFFSGDSQNAIEMLVAVLISFRSSCMPFGQLMDLDDD